MRTTAWRERLWDLATSTRILPVSDGVIIESLRLVHDRASSFASIAEAIRNDQSISAKIVSIANSAFYSRGIPILTLQRAMIAVGLEQTKQIITCIIFMNSILKGVRLWGPARTRLARNTLLVTYTAHRLAQKTLMVDPEKAFMAGLMHDVGRIIFCLCDRSYLSSTDRALVEGKDLCGFERQTYGIDHEETGYCLSRKWRFPDELTRVISHHHEYEGDADPLVRIVGIAQAFWNCNEEDLPLEALTLLPERQAIEERVERIVGLL
jgi:putative nucleotidyltransferase with HDIG domain